MSSHSRVFIQSNAELFDFMWFDLATDGSALFGLSANGQSDVELIIDSKDGKLGPDKFVQCGSSSLKMSFHSTGIYKMQEQVGKSPEFIDRVTVLGKRLSEIDSPQRMAEVLIPRRLVRTSKICRDRDIVLSTLGAPNGPLRCTIWCVPLDHFVTGKLVDTSIWEYSRGFASPDHHWIWTLRKSLADTIEDDKFHVMLIGEPRWKQSSANR